MTEREGALQQSTHLSAAIQDLEQKIQGLEAQKDQLEEDRFTAQTALQDLQSQHEEVTNDQDIHMMYNIHAQWTSLPFHVVDIFHGFFYSLW